MLNIELQNYSFQLHFLYRIHSFANRMGSHKKQSKQNRRRLQKISITIKKQERMNFICISLHWITLKALRIIASMEISAMKKRTCLPFETKFQMNVSMNNFGMENSELKEYTETKFLKKDQEEEPCL